MNRKKVAILTQPLGHNYGGVLQAYALQRYLIDIGCDVETFDRRKNESRLGSAKMLFRNVIKLLLGRIKSIPTRKRYGYILEELASFRDKRVSMSRVMLTKDDIRLYCKKNTIDAFIVGSDQVWRPRYSPSILDFYLDFADDVGNGAKRIAYAASFGVDNWEYSEELTDKCKNLARKFDHLSVRERSAVLLCKEKFGIDAKLVLDPTMLLENEDYLPLMQNVKESGFQGRLLSYVLDPAPEKRSIADAVAKVLDLEGISIKPDKNIAQVRRRDLALCKYPSVETWLKAFHDSDFIVTDSFHGTAFAILFNKPFVSVANPGRGLARFESLLSQFDLLDRLVASPDQITRSLVESDIDWTTVNSKKDSLATESRKFLKDAIGI